MRFLVTASNPSSNDADLTDLIMTSSSPAELTQALQGANAMQSSLAVGEIDVLEWDTANSCSVDGECGASERCRKNLCLIDVSNFLGEITFSVGLEADYTDALGNPQTTTTTVNLPIVFEQDEVIYRTTAVNEVFVNEQVVVDRESDGTLEVYTYTIGGIESYAPSDFITWTVYDRLVYKCGTSSQICISQTRNLDKDISHNSIEMYRFSLGGSLTTTKTPTEPYLSENCGQTIPCQERYSVAVAPPPATCGNDVVEGTELCDGTDLDDNDCTTIGQGFTGGDLYCFDNGQCDTWDTSSCTSGGDYVQFRTSDLSYVSSQAIAFGDSCDGTNLVPYGYESGSGSVSGTCEFTIDHLWCDGTCTRILENLPGGWKSGGSSPSLYRLDPSSGDYPYEMLVCDDDGGTRVVRRYDSRDSDATKVSNSADPTIPSNEVIC